MSTKFEGKVVEIKVAADRVFDGNVFEGKVVVVTGAGSGIGRGIAAGFCRDGAQVVGLGRTRSTLEETARRYGGGRMHVVVGDAASAEDVDRLFREVRARFGRTDILINNAAVYPKVSFLESSMTEWARVMEVNVVGVARCCHLALPGMLERGYGRVVNVGSMAWKAPLPQSSSYAASKAALRALTRAIAAEIDHERYPNVLVNELLPGIFRTSMSEGGEDPMSAYDHVRTVAALPSGGPHGQTFEKSALQPEDERLKTRAKRILARIARAR
jgi:NAD(P)-dependent dehydrogenase (short-subunit alcohol dehydrogenase family)